MLLWICIDVRSKSEWIDIIVLFYCQGLCAVCSATCRATGLALSELGRRRSSNRPPDAAFRVARRAHAPAFAAWWFASPSVTTTIVPYHSSHCKHVTAGGVARAATVSQSSNVDHGQEIAVVISLLSQAIRGIKAVVSS